MNILLIRPPRRTTMDISLNVPPLGLAYVAAAAEKAGHNVRILDAYALRWSWKKFVQHMQTEKVDVIGFTVMTPIWDIVKKAIHISQDSARKIVVGGPHPTAVKEKIFADAKQIDAAIIGEGEEAFVELLDWWEKDNDEKPPKGVLIQGRDFVERKAPNIQKISYPARHLLPNSRYRYLFATKKHMGTMITSRGCPFHCSFCDKSVGGSNWRARTAKDVVNEMEHMKKQFGIEFINIYDDNFLLHRKRVVEICQEIIKRKLQIAWKCEGRVDAVDRELLVWMEKAGCQMIAFGVESANPESLRLLRKDINIEQTKETFALLKDSSIRSLAYMILGVPGETTEDVENSIQFCFDLGVDYVQFSSLTKFPNTSISSQFQNMSSIKNPLDAEQERQTISSLPTEELERLMKKAWRDFYLRPRQITRVFRDSIRSGYVEEGILSSMQFFRWLSHHHR